MRWDVAMPSFPEHSKPCSRSGRLNVCRLNGPPVKEGLKKGMGFGARPANEDWRYAWWFALTYHQQNLKQTANAVPPSVPPILMRAGTRGCLADNCRRQAKPNRTTVVAHGAGITVTATS